MLCCASHAPNSLAKCHPPSCSKQFKCVQFKVMVAALTVFYMGHCKSLERVRPFIEAGGLVSLVGLVGHANLHVASQV